MSGSTASGSRDWPDPPDQPAPWHGPEGSRRTARAEQPGRPEPPAGTAEPEPAMPEHPARASHQPGPEHSGLRNPAAAVRGVGAGALAVEAVVLLLAIQPLRVMGVPLTGVAITMVVVLAVICLALAGLLRRPWAWWAGVAVQVLLFTGGPLFHWSLGVMGVVFGMVWGYVLHVRRTVLS